MFRNHGLKVVVLALALSATAGVASAQDYAFGWSPRTGDVWVDSRLGDMNDYGRRYREPFVDEMSRYYGAPRDLVTDLLVNQRWAPGDVYYACAIAQILGMPCRNVVNEWNRDHGQGWGAVAKRLGIKPGSAEFHRLKKGFVPTYDRWSRPIVLDRDLERDFPGRGKGVSHAGGGKSGHGNASHGKSSSPAHPGSKAKSGQGQGASKGKSGKSGGNKGGNGKGKG